MDSPIGALTIYDERARVRFEAVGCADTARARSYCRPAGVPCRAVTSDPDGAARAFVRCVNAGAQITPAIVVEAGRHKTLVVEPSDAERATLGTGAGY